METQLHSTLKVSSEQGLSDESIHIWQEDKNVFHNHQNPLVVNVIFNHSNKTPSRNVKLLPWLVPRLMPVSAGVGAGASVAPLGTGASSTGVFMSC